jgi:UDP-N-acetylglucosamine--N-acetylmuramyl-(pentapeptide) pyrophosphoryl-undecaprenol N-acetylglucosamine transferase
LQQHEQLKVIVSGGGTGGHIFPALAIANAIKKLMPNADILFVGAKGKMEMEKIPAAGYKIKGLWISGLKRELSVDNLSFPFKVISSLFNAHKIVSKFKPHVAVGVGGYASGPLLYVANAKGIPTLIQEQNSYPGITNKMLAKKAKRICVAYDGMEKFFPANKIVMTGNPVRENILDIENKKSEAVKFFGLNENKKTILVVGGSQGARSINQAIVNDLQKFVDADVQLVWQTGKTFAPVATIGLQKINSTNIKAFDFIAKMDLAYAMADLVISRAGASTVSELCVVGKPAIMVPLPTAAEDHQTKNILSLVNKNAAIMIKDAETKNTLVNTALQLIKNESELKNLQENILKLALPNSAEVIAKEVISLAGFKWN